MDSNTWGGLLTSLCVLALFPLAQHAMGHSIVLVYTFGEQAGDPYTDPKSKLLEGYDGAFYGTAFSGGGNGVGFGDGCIYRVTAQGNESVLYPFADGADGDDPVGALALGPDGYTMYGTSNNGVNQDGAVFTITPAGSFNVIATFPDDDSEGASINGGLVLGSDGQTFYGTSQYGGANENGVIFSVTTGGDLQVAYSFSALDGNNENYEGAGPTTGLTMGPDGVLYGVAPGGGQFGNGTVFSFSGGNATPLHSFSALDGNGHNLDGSAPTGEFAVDPHGDLYGVAGGGGKYGFGTLFRISTKTGVVTTLHDFKGGADGDYPVDVELGSGGALCGVTQGGMDAGGSMFYRLSDGSISDFSFPGGEAGAGLGTGLVFGSDGNFYGTTINNGNDGQGTVFEVKVTRNIINLYSTAAGKYAGDLQDDSGSVKLILGATGKVSGTLKIGRKSFAFRTTLDNSASFDVSLADGNSLSLQLNFANDAFYFAGQATGVGVTANRVTH